MVLFMESAMMLDFWNQKEILISLFAVVLILLCILPIVREIVISSKIKKLANSVMEITPKEFFL